MVPRNPVFSIKQAMLSVLRRSLGAGPSGGCTIAKVCFRPIHPRRYEGLRMPALRQRLAQLACLPAPLAYGRVCGLICLTRPLPDLLYSLLLFCYFASR